MQLAINEQLQKKYACLYNKKPDFHITQSCQEEYSRWEKSHKQICISMNKTKYFKLAIKLLTDNVNPSIR
jgi:hypothetical protein